MFLPCLGSATFIRFQFHSASVSQAYIKHENTIKNIDWGVYYRTFQNNKKIFVYKYCFTSLEEILIMINSSDNYYILGKNKCKPDAIINVA